MLVSLSLSELMDYTAWERKKWHAQLGQHGPQALQASAGPHGDGRIETVGELVRHIFAAEKRYVERLYSRPLTDPASFRSDDIEALFQLGRQSRKELQELVETWPTTDWDVPRDFKLLNFAVKATPRKIVVQTLMHEIRHWAQVATLLRMNGMAGEFHDFIASPVMGGEFRREQDHA
jgi:uncharacterized damage-inducible protein DinB